MTLRKAAVLSVMVSVLILVGLVKLEFCNRRLKLGTDVTMSTHSTEGQVLGKGGRNQTPFTVGDALTAHRSLPNSHLSLIRGSIAPRRTEEYDKENAGLFIVGCGSYAYINGRGEFFLWLPNARCGVSAVQFNSEGDVSIGEMTTITGASDETVHLTLPPTETLEYLPIDEWLTRSINSLIVIKNYCRGKTGYYGEICQQEVFVPALEEHAWLEEIATTLYGLEDTGN